jgi:hypothetical protein
MAPLDHPAAARSDASETPLRKASAAHPHGLQGTKTLQKKPARIPLETQEPPAVPAPNHPYCGAESGATRDIHVPLQASRAYSEFSLSLCESFK